MKNIEYQIEFFNYWHASSGLSSSTYADLLVNKTRDGFPYIPGRTIKGLLREAAESINQLESNLVTVDFIKDIFGQQPGKADYENEIATTEAQCFFGNANISSNLRKRISEEDKPLLYSILAATKINEDGVAANGTLRQMEVAIPLTLYATIAQFPAKDGYEQQLRHCFNLVKRMGLNRSKGLGRCKFSIINS